MASEQTVSDPPPSFDAVNDDPFQILGVESSATDDEIKAAYRKLVLKYHPDKNPGDAQAELMFQRVQTAHGILSNPELRAKYDAGGLAALDDASLQQHGLQVDVSQTGIVGSTLLAMFRKLGHPIKTVVSPVVMDAVKDRNVAATPLDWDTPQKGKVGNGQAVFYTVNITQEHLTQGFIIQATCVHARVKLLLWDMNTTGEWSLAAQEDAIKLGDSNVSALFNVGADLLEGVPKSVQAFIQQQAMVDKGGSDPLNHIFRVLDASKLRDPLSLKPGTHLLAVYGDNFFKRSQYTVSATLQQEGLGDGLQKTEKSLIEKRAELLAFEKEFKKSRAEFEAAVTRLEGFTKELDELFVAREKEYEGILGLPAASGSGTAAGSRSQDEADAPEGGSSPPRNGSMGAVGSATTQIYGGMTEAGKMVRSAGSSITGAFKGLWSKTGKSGGSQATGGEPAGVPGPPSQPEAQHSAAQQS